MSDLVERVARAVFGHQYWEDGEEHARQAIAAVADWLDDNNGFLDEAVWAVARNLRRELERQDNDGS